jgi:hypothetical protein
VNTGPTAGPLTAASALVALPASLREALLDAFREIVVNFRERRWEPSELNGGKLAEVVYTILHGHVTGKFPAKPTKPQNMVDACRALEKSPASFPRSVRIQIPRMLMALYEIRNNRGVGHVGGDVDPNHMDAVAVLYMAKWIVAELLRVFHNVSTAEAAALVDVLVEREVPIVWEVGGRRRILKPGLSRTDKTLLLVYSEPEPVHDEDLAAWVEHPNIGYFRRDVLRPAHRQKLIEFDEETHLVYLSPLGAAHVEQNLPLAIAS